MTALAYAPSEYATCAGCGIQRRVNGARQPRPLCGDCKKGYSEPMRDYWAGRGACRDHDPDIWFPTTTDPADAETAKLICSTCVVRWSCLESALQRREEHGVWGGFTTRERNVILRHRLRTLTDH